MVDEDGCEYARISMNKFVEESSKLLSEIKNTKQRAFEIPETKAFMGEIGCTKLKAPSTDKADIHIVIHDLRTNMTPLLGFSIKSQLGSASTLLNAGATTNITYKVAGAYLSDSDIDMINSIDSHLDRLKAVYNKGCLLTYKDIDHSVFRNNLQFLDICMPQFIAECLLVDSVKSNSSIDYCVTEVANKNPLIMAVRMLKISMYIK